ncbi:Orotidine 5'-phosphate decarboxylase [archaeon HR04]|nr:Orotidine 5'-phosphate decarboxylase [archaeon HR04]
MKGEEMSYSKDDNSNKARYMPNPIHAPTPIPTPTPSIFLKRLSASVEEHDGSRVVLALDLSNDVSVEKVCSIIDALAGYICSVKMNMHLLLPLSMDDVKYINDHAHSHGLQSIADIKLNDIPSTNKVAIDKLAESNFDALTINPIIGLDALKDAIHNAHSRGMGAIALVYMSHKGAESSYGMRIKMVYGEQDDEQKQQREDVQLQQRSPSSSSSSPSPSTIYRVFLGWALAADADGIVVGSTRPEMIRECRAYIEDAHMNVAIFSPGSGAQGGDPSAALSNGADYIIVGRSILNADDPVREASRLARISLISRG